MTTILLGAEREHVLRTFGFSPAFIEELSNPTPPVGPSMIAGDGQVLAEIQDFVGVKGALPEGRIVPIRQINDADLWYDLLVEREHGWALMSWLAEGGDWYDCGVAGYLTDLVADAWEAEADAQALLPWARRVGHPAPEALLTILERGGYDRRALRGKLWEL